MKKNYLLISIGMVIIAGVIGYFFAMRDQGSGTIPESPSQGTLVPSYTPDASPYSSPTGTPGSIGGKIRIPGYEVEMNDFYASSEVVTNDRSALIIFDPTFSVHYEASDKSFTLSIHADPIAYVRKSAENYFLEKLGISREQACALQVRVYVDMPEYPARMGIDYGLSFCPQGSSF